MQIHMQGRKLRLIRVEPVTTKKSLAFVSRRDGSGVEEVEFGVYPAESKDLGEKIRKRRLELQLSLREACEALQFRLVEYSGLERGEYKLSEHDFKSAISLMDLCAAAKRLMKESDN